MGERERERERERDARERERRGEGALRETLRKKNSKEYISLAIIPPVLKSAIVQTIMFNTNLQECFPIQLECNHLDQVLTAHAKNPSRVLQTKDAS